MKAGGFRRLGPAAIALILALGAASGVAPATLRGEEQALVVVDDSPSCAPLRPAPAGALVLSDPDLSGTLARAAARAEPRRVRLYTDGCDGRGMPAIPAGAVYDVVLRPRRDNIGLGELQLPDRVGVGETVSVRIPVSRTAGPGEEARSVVLRLWRDGLRVGPGGIRIELERGQARTVRIADRVDRAGLVQYRATIEGDLGPSADDAVEQWVRVGDEPVVLVLGDALPLPGCAPIAIPVAQAVFWLGDPLRRARIDAVVVAEAVGARDAQRALAEAVRDGTGLIVLDARGQEGGALAPLLPLTERPPEGRALVVLLDYSGSMVPHLDALQAAATRLLARFGADDRVAAIAFRDEVAFATPWTGADTATWPIRAHRPHGNTRLMPALRECRRMLAEVSARTRRVFVVSDGRWGELDDGGAASRELATACEQLVADGADLAALFVGTGIPREARLLFPRFVEGGADLPDELVSLEDRAPDRRIAGPVAALASAGPAWLGAGPPDGEYRDVARLFPRGVGERLVLRAGSVPLAAAHEPAGRVLQLAPSLEANPVVREALPGLVRAVSRADTDARIETEWTSRGLRVVGHGGYEGAFRVGDRTVPSRITGFRRREALVDDPPAAPVRIEWGPARQVTAGPAYAELAGLHARPGVAAAIAAASGGAYRDREDGATAGRTPRSLPAALLGPALLLVVLSAVLRRLG